MSTTYSTASQLLPATDAGGRSDSSGPGDNAAGGSSGSRNNDSTEVGWREADGSQDKDISSNVFLLSALLSSTAAKNSVSSSQLWRGEVVTLLLLSERSTWTSSVHREFSQCTFFIASSELTVIEGIRYGVDGPVGDGCSSSSGGGGNGGGDDLLRFGQHLITRRFFNFRFFFFDVVADCFGICSALEFMSSQDVSFTFHTLLFLSESVTSSVTSQSGYKLND